jgi:hypothetical protein
MDFLVVLGIVTYFSVFIFGFKYYTEIRYGASDLEIIGVVILGISVFFYGLIKIGQAMSAYLYN